jgi:nicotinate phosphoribosyltransferase
VRIDSGDLVDHARRVRAILDAGGLTKVRIFASGNLDEIELKRLLAAEVPIDGFGIGTRLDVSADAPYLDCVYKLEEYAGQPRRKRSEGKATWPGRKQVFREFADGQMIRDTVTVEGDTLPGVPLLQLVMQKGRRVAPSPPLSLLREQASRSLSQLPVAVRSLDTPAAYPVTIAPALHELAQQVDARARH